MASSELTVSGFFTLRFFYPGLTGSDPLALAGPNSVLSPTRPLFKSSLVSRFRRSSQGSLSPALSTPCPALTVVQSFRETDPRHPTAFLHPGRTPAAL